MRSVIKNVKNSFLSKKYTFRTHLRLSCIFVNWRRPCLDKGAVQSNQCNLISQTTETCKFFSELKGLCNFTCDWLFHPLPVYIGLQRLTRDVDLYGIGGHVPPIFMKGDVHGRPNVPPHILEVMSFMVGLFYPVTATTVVCCILMQILRVVSQKA